MKTDLQKRIAIDLTILLAAVSLFMGILVAMDRIEYNRNVYHFTEEQKDLMARVLWVEAGSNSRLLQTACASVMLNQLDSGHYGDTIDKVLSRSGAYDGYRLIERADGQDISECRSVVDQLCKSGSALPGWVWFFSVDGFTWEGIQTYAEIEGVSFQYFPEDMRAAGWH